MEQKSNDRYEKRLREIDKRVDDLRQHQEMWRKAGGKGFAMADKAKKEIDTLLEEKERILSGSQQKIDELEDIKNILELFKKRVKSRKRREEYTSEIRLLKEQIEEAKGMKK